MKMAVEIWNSTLIVQIRPIFQYLFELYSELHFSGYIQPPFSSWMIQFWVEPTCPIFDSHQDQVPRQSRCTSPQDFEHPIWKLDEKEKLVGRYHQIGCSKSWGLVHRLCRRAWSWWESKIGQVGSTQNWIIQEEKAGWM
jgi:hypothetical protein